MASTRGNSLLLSVLMFSIVIAVSSRGAVYRPPTVEPLTDRFSHVTVNQSFSQIWGGQNIHVKNNGSNVDIVLDKTTGCGLVSKNKYYYGFFSAAMKLPPGFTSGVVVAFYLSNADVYPRNHDEIDIELLGHERRKEWVLQTNIYGNGSVHTGREEKFYLWFDPTLDFHQYSILWNNHHTVFLVDNVPVREVIHNAEIGSVYPSKPMSLYTTIWDGSEWATRGGKYPVDYKYAPFVTSMGELELEGCVTGDKDSVPPCSKSSVSSLDPVEGEQYAKLSKQQSDAMAWSRGKHMFYSYCKDTKRYKVLPAECNAN